MDHAKTQRREGELGSLTNLGDIACDNFPERGGRFVPSPWAIMELSFRQGMIKFKAQELAEEYRTLIIQNWHEHITR